MFLAESLYVNKTVTSVFFYELSKLFKTDDKQIDSFVL